MGSDAEVTAADRERAVHVAYALSELLDDSSGLYPAGLGLIAQALADERAKARAQVLNAAADAWEGKGAGWFRQARIAMGAHTGAVVAAWLRRAAEDPPEVSQT